MPKYELVTTAEVYSLDDLRSYPGWAKAVTVSQASVSGVFTFDPTDTSSSDDGANTIVSNNGKRWKRSVPAMTAMSFTAAGAGATARTAQSKMRDIISVKDTSETISAANLATAISSNDQRTIIVPVVGDDTALPADYSGVLLDYPDQRPLRSTHASTIVGTAKRAFKAQFPASHADTQWSAFHIETQSQGSGKNGPGSADYGQTIAIHKKGYAEGTSPPAGELDGLSITVRVDGPKGEASGSDNSSDGGGILLNVQNVDDCGFLAAIEAATTNYNRSSGAIVRHIQTQIGALDMNGSGAPGYGFVAVSKVGTNDHAFYAGEDGGDWTNILYSPNGVRIDIAGNYYAPTADWANGSWSIIRTAGVNGATTFMHRGTGTFLINAQEVAPIRFAIAGTEKWEVGTTGEFRPVANLGSDLGSATRRVSQLWAFQLNLGSTSTNGVLVTDGDGSPEGVTTANVGSLYLRRNGGANTTLYVKESGTGNTGWVAK